MGIPDREHVEVASREDLHAWLLDHHDQPRSVWLVTYKKATPEKHIPHEEVLDELVAFGWIDGTRRRVDPRRTSQLVSPRRTQPWARSYKDRAERLLAEGRMQPSGAASVAAAKASGMWTAMDDVDDLVVPPDLAAALARRRGAADAFAEFAPSTRRNVLRWIASAKTAPTRDKRVRAAAEAAGDGRPVRSHG